MDIRFTFSDRLQARIALLAIGRSTLRNQGAPGVIMAAREYLRKINLSDFSVGTRADFDEALNGHTRRLMNRFPKGAKKSWGGARKALNIFLRDVIYNRFLSQQYALAILEPWLELPLDSNTYEGISVDAMKHHVVPNWPRIKYLAPDVSADLQLIAQEIAIHFNTHRVHLDIKYWRKPHIDNL